MVSKTPNSKKLFGTNFPILVDFIQMYCRPVKCDNKQLYCIKRSK